MLGLISGYFVEKFITLGTCFLNKYITVDVVCIFVYVKLLKSR